MLRYVVLNKHSWRTHSKRFERIETNIFYLLLIHNDDWQHVLLYDINCSKKPTLKFHEQTHLLYYLQRKQGHSVGWRTSVHQLTRNTFSNTVFHQLQKSMCRAQCTPQEFGAFGRHIEERQEDWTEVLVLCVRKGAQQIATTVTLMPIPTDYEVFYLLII